MLSIRVYIIVYLFDYSIEGFIIITSGTGYCQGAHQARELCPELSRVSTPEDKRYWWYTQINVNPMLI